MNFRSAKKLIDKAFEEEEKETFFRVYLVDRLRMEKVISFNEYLTKIGYKKHLKYILDKRPTEDILNEVKDVEIKLKAQAERNKNGTV